MKKVTYKRQEEWGELSCEWKAPFLEFSDPQGELCERWEKIEPGLWKGPGGRLESVRFFKEENWLWLWWQGRNYRVELKPKGPIRGGEGELAGDLGEVVAEMPGKVLEVLVSAGDEVKKGDSLLVMESMKMELNIHATHEGRVEQVHCQAGEMVAQGALLISWEQEDE